MSKQKPTSQKTAKRHSFEIAALLLVALVLIPTLLAGAQPGGSPPTGNVDANFNSVAAGDTTGPYSGVSAIYANSSSLNGIIAEADIGIGAYSFVGVASDLSAAVGLIGPNGAVEIIDGLSGQSTTIDGNGNITDESGTITDNIRNDGGRYIGSTAPQTGNMGGYEAARTLCENAYSGYAGVHVCTVQEITNSYELDPTGPVSSASGTVWVNNGAPAYIEDLSNDCNGWRSNDADPNFSTYGSTWIFTKAGVPSEETSSLISFCSNSLPVACCAF